MAGSVLRKRRSRFAAEQLTTGKRSSNGVLDVIGDAAVVSAGRSIGDRIAQTD